ncbi:MAG: hypothetical protein KIT84_45020 [Labilithrix sp.]|nr:hypothetical protein [Labilithrix sp.]MCW5818245.1 hypothetical protein [Labilithrix sp.]
MMLTRVVVSISAILFRSPVARRRRTAFEMPPIGEQGYGNSARIGR